jgi:D-3-phosphoglycerate dehydrogenase
LSWRILITDGLAPEGLDALRAVAEVVEADELGGLGNVDALIVRSRTHVNDVVLAAGAPRLKVVGRAGVGVDNIDLAAARARGVIVVNAPMASTIAVAEHTLALMLALAKSVPQADASVRAGEWRKSTFQGIELDGKTLGLIGVGRIGAALAERAAGLGMRVIAYDPYLRDHEISDRHAQPSSLGDLLAQSDFISLHVPLTADTRGLLGAHELAAVKPGARVVCTARGGLIDEAALLQALNDGRLAGAALDVFENEPPGITALTTHPKVICTPHIAAQTVEAQRRASIDIAAEVLAALKGGTLRWRLA